MLFFIRNNLAINSSKIDCIYDLDDHTVIVTGTQRFKTTCTARQIYFYIAFCAAIDGDNSGNLEDFTAAMPATRI
jgi:hypothetical protein